VSTPAAASPSGPVPRRSRAFIVGDSTLLAVRNYKTFKSFRGFDYEFDARSCRTLGIVSCGRRPKPLNTVEAIEHADGRFDVVVVMAGYDEWWTSFPSSFDAVVAAARAKGASTIVWLGYREDVVYENPDGVRGAEAYIKNNETLREKVAEPAYSDVVVLDWNTYSSAAPSWMAADGIHLTVAGAHGVADYISRMIAHLDDRPCPITPQPTTEVCPNPDTVGPSG